MSVEIIYYPDNANDDDLVDHLISLGYSKTSHIWNWPTGSRHYSWFKDEDYVSFDGVEATVYPSNDKTSTEVKWHLHTRTRSSSSAGDREFQNLTIRTARKKYGGWFNNDWRGKNRYIEVNPDQRDAVARGIYLSFDYVTEQLSMLHGALPNPLESLEKLADTKLALIASHDPTRVLYNAIIPFAVAAIEHFFSQSFKIMLHYDNKAQAKLKKLGKKVEVADVFEIRDGTKSIEDITPSHTDSFIIN